MEVGVVGLLRTAWVAATMPILVAAVPCSGLASFHGAVLGFAKRGKITQSSSQVKDLMVYFGLWSVWLVRKLKKLGDIESEGVQLSIGCSGNTLGGTSRNLKVIPRNGSPLFHLYTKRKLTKARAKVIECKAL
ncbi:hypothetical protein FF1_034405 [Malus domestica]